MNLVRILLTIGISPSIVRYRTNDACDVNVGCRQKYVHLDFKIQMDKKGMQGDSVDIAA